MNDNLLKSKNVILFGKVTKIYELTEKSKFLLRVHGKAIYRTNTSQLEHDYLLLKTYCSLPEEIRSSWINETELKLQYGNITTTDAVFIYKNKKIAVEVLTSNYSDAIIKEKLEFASTYCDDILTLNTNKIKV